MKMSLFQPFTVRYYEVDAGGRLAVEHLCNYMQQIAGQHAEKLGVGFGVLHDLGLTWVLARWQVAIDKLPEAGQEVVLETWPSSVERLQCRREFILRDATGEILARGGSWWVVVNLTTFRLERVPAEVMDVYAGRSGFAMEDFGLRLAQVKEAQAKAAKDAESGGIVAMTPKQDIAMLFVAAANDFTARMAAGAATLGPS